jgi:hypothetical protein
MKFNCSFKIGEQPEKIKKTHFTQFRTEVENLKFARKIKQTLKFRLIIPHDLDCYIGRAMDTELLTILLKAASTWIIP